MDNSWLSLVNARTMGTGKDSALRILSKNFLGQQAVEESFDRDNDKDRNVDYCGSNVGYACVYMWKKRHYIVSSAKIDASLICSLEATYYIYMFDVIFHRDIFITIAMKL